MRMRVLPVSRSFSSEAASSSANAAAAAAPPPPSASAPLTRTRTSTRTEEELYLNIYDISPINHCLYWFGLGIFYSGIEVHGMEYGFGAHEYPTSGVFQVEPKSCPGFIFRRSVCVGTTDMSRSEVHNFIENLAEDYHGDTYHLIAKNCNHFTADVCERLTGKPIPGWVNRLARLGSFCNCVLPIVEITGSFCNCVLPESINVSAVRDVTAHPGFSGSHAVVEGAAGQLHLSAPSCSVSIERAQDDGLESIASIVDDSDVDDLDHLLTTPNSDVLSSKDKALTPARDSF